MTSCRWPLGGPWDHVEFFCGEPTIPGSSWCKEHRKRAFVRESDRGSDKKPMVLKDLRNKRRPGVIRGSRRQFGQMQGPGITSG